MTGSDWGSREAWGRGYLRGSREPGLGSLDRSWEGPGTHISLPCLCLLEPLSSDPQTNPGFPRGQVGMWGVGGQGGRTPSTRSSLFLLQSFPGSLAQSFSVLPACQQIFWGRDLDLSSTTNNFSFLSDFCCNNPLLQQQIPQMGTVVGQPMGKRNLRDWKEK